MVIYFCGVIWYTNSQVWFVIWHNIINIFAGYEAFERMAFYGVASNLVNYLTSQLHEDTVSSVRNVNNWSGSVWITPILGAYIADSYLGRFWTFTLSSLIYVLVSYKIYRWYIESRIQFSIFSPWWIASTFIIFLFQVEESLIFILIF